MQNNSKKNTRSYLIAALAAFIAFSAMAASVMAGCGENSESAASGNTNETEIVTMVETKVVTETMEVDENGNPVEQSSGSGSENKNGSSSGSGNSSKSENSGNSSSSGSKNNNAASNGGNSSGGNSNGGSSNSGDKTSSAGGSDKNDSSSGSNSSSGGSSGSKVNPNVCRVDGQKFKVGDTIVCTYRLKTPEILENYQGTIRYDSKNLKVKKAKLESPAKIGSVINFKLNGRIEFNGSIVGEGYDYTKGGKFMTVTYEVLSGGTVNTSIDWVAACVLDDSNRDLIKNGKPAPGFTVTKSYTKA